MLKATVLDAVQAVREAVEDLAVAAEVTRRVIGPHVPGQAPSTTDSTSDAMVVLLKYATKEVDNDRIKASDYKAIILPAEGQESVSADVNDLLQVASFKTFRIITAEKVMVGTTVGLVTAQLRFV